MSIPSPLLDRWPDVLVAVAAVIALVVLLRLRARPPAASPRRRARRVSQTRPAVTAPDVGPRWTFVNDQMGHRPGSVPPAVPEPDHQPRVGAPIVLPTAPVRRAPQAPVRPVRDDYVPPRVPDVFLDLPADDRAGGAA